MTSVHNTRSHADLRISRAGGWESDAQGVRVEQGGVVELFLCARPSPGEVGFVRQARSMYENLSRVLSHHGAEPSDVIVEKIFLSDTDRQFRDLQEIRRECYDGTPRTIRQAPAAAFLHQPPCHPGRLCELQAYVTFSTGGAGIAVRTLPGLPGLVSGKVVERDGVRHLYVMNLTGEQESGDGQGLQEQARGMFSRAEMWLQHEGLSFRDVLRTWIYVRDIERDYADLNRVRTQFFLERGVTRLPASTGIQGATHPRERRCVMDLYALAGSAPVKIDVMRAPTQNEAHEYGSSFSRGMKVALGDRTVLYVSGTASIDTEGRVLHEGDIAGQLHRMFLNVEQLLAAERATMQDLVTATTYLKRPGDLHALHAVCRERCIPPDIPTTVTVADICRPQWLCEVEGIAVIPRGTSTRQ